MDDDFGRLFREMAVRIAKIEPAEFAGAAVIVPRTGDPIVFMLADPQPKPGQFWGGVTARVEIAASEAQQSAQDAQFPYGGRR
jgi:hypothetical protein